MMPCSARLRQLAGLALLGLATFAPAAAQTDARLLGSWEVRRVLDANGEDDTKPNEGATMTFGADGTLVVQFTDADRKTVGEAIKTSYRVDGTVLIVRDDDEKERSLVYRFEDDELVLTPDPATLEVAYLRRTPPGQ